MKKQVDKNIIKDISLKHNARPPFVEKDFYSVKILKELANIHYSGASLVFTVEMILSEVNAFIGINIKISMKNIFLIMMEYYPNTLRL